MHHADKRIGVTMSSAGVIVWAMSFVLMCLASSMPPASAASGSGGILHIPSAASLAHCPSRCGGVNISYPFGVGAGCFRQGFELTCNQSTQPPKLFLGNSTTQVTAIYGASVEALMFSNITLGSGMNNYSMSWDAPAKGITISNYNAFYALGCDFDVKLFDYVGNPIGSCMSRCRGEVLPNQVFCNNTGCCFISLQQGISGFQATIVRADDTAARSDSMHPSIVAFMSSNYYSINATDLFSSWTNANASKIDGAVLEVAIMDQPSCRSAQMNNGSYACAANTNCMNASYGGYTCYCNDGYYYTANAYLSEGCPPQQDYYNPKPKEHCPTSCGNMTIPFPFGLEEDCSANEKFLLNCTAAGETLFSIGGIGDRYTKYHVTSVSVEDGTLTVSNMLKNASSVKEVIIANTDEHGGLDIEGPVEDVFDF